MTGMIGEIMNNGDLINQFQEYIKKTKYKALLSDLSFDEIINESKIFITGTNCCIQRARNGSLPRIDRPGIAIDASVVDSPPGIDLQRSSHNNWPV